MDEGTDAGEFVDVFDVLLDTFLILQIWLLDVLAQLLDQQRDYLKGASQDDTLSISFQWAESLLSTT